MTLDQVLDILRREIAAVGTAKAWSDKHGVSESYTSDILNRRRDPSKPYLKLLGLERRVTYHRKRN